MRLYPEPEHKRAMAKSIGTFDIEAAMRWEAAAALQEADLEDDYRLAHDAWKAVEPQREYFLPHDVRVTLAAKRAALKKERRAWIERMWGDFGARP